MDVIAIGPLPAGSLLWQRQGNRVLTVVCKATFALQQGESTLARQQDPLHPADVYFEDDPAHSVWVPADLVPFKARADVVLVGEAFAPRGEPAWQMVVRLIVGDMDKSFAVVGDQAWGRDGALRRGQPFARMALRYERAGGGPETANPIGVSPDAPPDSYGMTRLPNLHPQGFVPLRQGEVIAPVGFGPLSAAWSARRDKLGRAGSLPERWDAAPLPDDLDPAYFNCAPRDQQVEALRPNERLVLENLHPQHPRLVTNLPGVRPRAFADRGEGPQEIALGADTLWIDAARALCTLTWRGYVESPPAGGSVVVAMEGPNHALPWVEVQEAARAAQGPRSSHTLTFIGGGVGGSAPVRTGDALPFGKRSPTRVDEPVATPRDALRSTGMSALPFRDASAWDPPPSRPEAPSSPWAAGAPAGGASAMVAMAPSVLAPAPVMVAPAPVVAAPAPVVAPAIQRAAAAGLPGGAAAASDAAAAAMLSSSPPPASGATARASARAPRAATGDVLDLLWYDEPQVPRIRAWWEELVTELDFEPSDPRRDPGAEDPDKARGRHNVFGIMSDGAVIDVAAVPRVIAEAVNDRGRFTPPLALVGGELRFPFDEVETLRATVVAMTPLVGTDKRLKESLDAMNELLKTPYLQGSTGVAPKLTRELRDQFREPSRALPAGYLDGHVERLLLEQRRYAVRKVFGGEFIRALLGAPGAAAEASIPVYLPKHLDQTLPMLIVMKARLIVEAHLQQDLYDTSPYALRAVALGRSFQLDALRAPG